MNDLEALITAAVASPNDETTRGALADWLDENEYPDITAKLRDGRTGPTIIRKVYKEADRLGVRPNIHLLWYLTTTHGTRKKSSTRNRRGATTTTQPARDWADANARRRMDEAMERIRRFNRGIAVPGVQPLPFVPYDVPDALPYQFTNDGVWWGDSVSVSPTWDSTTGTYTLNAQNVWRSSTLAGALGCPPGDSSQQVPTG